MKTNLTLCALAITLWGCNDTSGPSGPPDLTMRDVVGCWKQHDDCKMHCFEQGGGYYGFITGSQGDMYESRGYFTLNRFTVNITKKIISKLNTKNDAVSLDYKRINGKLIALDGAGSETQTYYDSVDIGGITCATPWKYFTKPAGWDSLVKPLP